MLAALLLCHRGVLTAQSIAADSALRTKPTRGLWIAGSLGAATFRTRPGDGAALGSLDANLQRGPWLTTLRGQFLSGGGQITAVSILLGRGTTATSIGFASASVGFTGLATKPCINCLFAENGQPARDGVGFMVAGDAALRMGRSKGLGVGLAGFIAVNTAKSYAGIGLEIPVGVWR